MGFLQSHGRHRGGDGQARLIAVAAFSQASFMPTFRSLDDADVKGKRVLVRVDLNVPMQDGKVSDSTRIEEIVPTITELADKGGKIILLSHFDRPKGRDLKYSLRPVAAEVARLVKRPVAFADDCIGPKAEAAVAAMKNGDIVCLENTRFHPGEEKNDKELAKKLAALGDIFVNDAFSVAHREHASTTTIVTDSKLLAYPGRAMKAELDALERAFERPQHPVTAIVGGAKVSTKLELLGNLLTKVETLIIGGAMANTFLVAQGKRIGKSLFESDLIGAAADIVSRANALGREIVLPVDAVVAAELATHAPSHVLSVDEVGAGDMILDIGPRTIEHVVSVLARSKTLVWNGPFGAFEHEPFDNGTIEVAEAAAELTAAGKLVSFAGGGDTVAALNVASVKDRMTHVSTGGGAFLESLEGKTLPGVKVLLVAEPTRATAG
jgi:phosphoglycerate kinase